MHALGKHILLDLKDCNRERLDDVDFLRDILVRAAKNAGCEVLEKTFRKFSPQGVSGVVVVAESHLSIHTWPEYGYVAVDVFTCGTSVRPELAAETLIAALQSRNPSIMEVTRGVLQESEVRSASGR